MLRRLVEFRSYCLKSLICVFGPFEQLYQAGSDQFDQEEPLLITFLFHILSEGIKNGNDEDC